MLGGNLLRRQCVNVSNRTYDPAYSVSFIRSGVSRYDVVVGTREGIEWYRHSAPSTKRQCLCLDKLLIHSRATNGVLTVARDTKFSAVDIRATSLGMGAVARRMMEWRVARRNHFSSRPSIIIGGVSGREAGGRAGTQLNTL